MLDWFCRVCTILFVCLRSLSWVLRTRVASVPRGESLLLPTSKSLISPSSVVVSGRLSILFWSRLKLLVYSVGSTATEDDWFAFFFCS